MMTQFEIGLVDQRGGLKGVAGPLGRQSHIGDLAELLVNLGGQIGGRSGSVFPGEIGRGVFHGGRV